MSVCNTISTVVPSCAPFTNSWMNLHYHNHEWIVNTDHVTAPRYYSDVLTQEVTKEHQKDQMSRALKEKNVKKNNKYIHVPHKDKPPQVVAKRNARERRRVQAVNSAFTRLRKAVPLENNRYLIYFRLYKNSRNRTPGILYFIFCYLYSSLGFLRFLIVDSLLEASV